MPKPFVIGLIIAGAVVVVGGGALLLTSMNKTATTNNTGTNASSSSSKVALDDPDGTYNFFSDPSVTKYPEKDVKFGNGQTLTFEYDGSKTNNDPYATLSYYPFYIQDNGKVQPLGGGNVEGKGSGTFTVSDSVFDSNAKNHSGFLQIVGTYDTGVGENGITGKTVTLGMYPIVFDIAE